MLGQLNIKDLNNCANSFDITSLEFNNSYDTTEKNGRGVSVFVRFVGNTLPRQTAEKISTALGYTKTRRIKLVIPSHLTIPHIHYNHITHRRELIDLDYKLAYLSGDHLSHYSFLNEPNKDIDNINHWLYHWEVINSAKLKNHILNTLNNRQNHKNIKSMLEQALCFCDENNEIRQIS